MVSNTFHVQDNDNIVCQGCDKQMIKYRTADSLSAEERGIIQYVKWKTKKYNIDNISRTDAYFQYYNQQQEIHWSFLASMVSRNAGWNMCDLEGCIFPHLLPKETRKLFFLTYERANWLIFHDAFPQLLLYQYSTKKNQPMFHLLKFFHVSSFMEREWNYYWKYKDHRRLLFSLIINEQHVIHKPVICHPYYQKEVFHSILYLFQDWFHFSFVLLPTCNGALYGTCVNGFANVNKRIELGKRIASILFNDQLYPKFYEFASSTIHTGSRYDYESYFMSKKKRDTPFLRTKFPIVKHSIHHYDDWFTEREKHAWYKSPSKSNPTEIADWFEKKQTQLRKLVLLKHLITD